MTAEQDKLEKRFHDEMLRIYHEAKRNCPGYKGNRFIQMVHEDGGYMTAKNLLVNREIQEGFANLLICGCLHLTGEHLVLEPEFEGLFSEEERERARERLGR